MSAASCGPAPGGNARGRGDGGGRWPPELRRELARASLSGAGGGGKLGRGSAPGAAFSLEGEAPSLASRPRSPRPAPRAPRRRPRAHRPAHSAGPRAHRLATGGRVLAARDGHPRPAPLPAPRPRHAAAEVPRPWPASPPWRCCGAPRCSPRRSWTPLTARPATRSWWPRPRRWAGSSCTRGCCAPAWPGPRPSAPLPPPGAAWPRCARCCCAWGTSWS